MNTLTKRIIAIMVVAGLIASVETRGMAQSSQDQSQPSQDPSQQSQSSSQPPQDPSQSSQSGSSQSGQQQQKQQQQKQTKEASKQELKVTQQEQQKKVTDINKASKLVGMQVKNTKDEDVGKISDVVVDWRSGKIAYAVVSAGGVLGMGGKMIAVPFNAFTPAQGDKHLVLNLDKQQLEQAQGFAKNEWPSLDAVAQGKTVGLASGSKQQGQQGQQSQQAQPSQSQEAIGGTSSGSEQTSGSGQSSEEKSTNQLDQSTSGSSTNQESSGGTGSGTQTNGASASSGAAAGAITQLSQFSSAGDASTLEGKQVQLSDTKVKQVFGENAALITSDQAGSQPVLVKSQQSLSDFKPNQKVKITGTAKKVPSDPTQLGLDSQAMQHIQGQQVYIEASQVTPADQEQE